MKPRADLVVEVCVASSVVVFAIFILRVAGL